MKYIDNFNSWINEGRIPKDRHHVDINELSEDQRIKLYILDRCTGSSGIVLNLDSLRIEKAGKQVTGDRILIDASSLHVNDICFSITEHLFLPHAWGKGASMQHNYTKMMKIVDRATELYKDFQIAPSDDKFPDKPEPKLFRNPIFWKESDANNFIFKQFGIVDTKEHEIIKINDVFQLTSRVTIVGTYNLIEFGSYPQNLICGLCMGYRDPEHEREGFRFSESIAWKFAHIFPYYPHNLLLLYNRVDDEKLITPVKDEKNVEALISLERKGDIKFKDIKSIITTFGDSHKYRGYIDGQNYGI